MTTVKTQRYIYLLIYQNIYLLPGTHNSAVPSDGTPSNATLHESHWAYLREKGIDLRKMTCR